MSPWLGVIFQNHVSILKIRIIFGLFIEGFELILDLDSGFSFEILPPFGFFPIVLSLCNNSVEILKLFLAPCLWCSSMKHKYFKQSWVSGGVVFYVVAYSYNFIANLILISCSNMICNIFVKRLLHYNGFYQFCFFFIRPGWRRFLFSFEFFLYRLIDRIDQLTQWHQRIHSLFFLHPAFTNNFHWLFSWLRFIRYILFRISRFSALFIRYLVWLFSSILYKIRNFRAFFIK